MQKAEQGNFEPFDASDWKIGIVVAEFNRHISDELYEHALKRAEDYKMSPENITTVRIAGIGEAPLTLQAMAASGSYQAILPIGCAIKGETQHFEYLCKFVTEGILRVQLDHKQPIAFGILMCNTEEQAKARAHLGGDHLDAVLQQAKTIQHIKQNER